MPLGTYISFTVKFSHDLLQQWVRSDTSKASAAQPREKKDTTDTDWLKIAAVRARGDLRWANHLARKRDWGTTWFSDDDWWYLRKLDNDTLRIEANKATRAFGHGRLKHRDGSFTDIGGSSGGVTRTVLDDYQPPIVESSDEEQ